MGRHARLVVYGGPSVFSGRPLYGRSNYTESGQLGRAFWMTD